jgi:AraC-like DNA-binding protein/quercetin dioxygenase-like cupin family protein
MSPRRTDRAEIVAFQTSTHFNVEVMRTWYRAQEFARHAHPYFTIGLMQRGIGTLWAAGTSHTLRRGDAVVIPSGEVHTGGLDTSGGVLSYIALHVPTDLVPVAHDFGTAVLREPRLTKALARVAAAVQQRDDAAAESGVIAVIEQLGQRNAGDPAVQPAQRGEPSFVRIARGVIDDCFADNTRTSLTALASEARVSAFHLVREFKRSIGLSPHQYVVQIRVRRAAELLARGVPISDTAATVGFTDQAHLTTHFRRHLGATPAAWQRATNILGGRLPASR